MVSVSIDVSLAPVATSRTSGKDAAAPRRRSELASFLRSRRERLDPEVLGLPTGTRRRTPGLRREEVAQLAGVGVTWYTWLEQGRQINASVQVLDAVARTLRLDPAETEHLYQLADVPAVPAVSGCRRLDPEVQQILDGLRPLPVAVVNGRSDVLAWNRLLRAAVPVHGERAGGQAELPVAVLHQPQVLPPLREPRVTTWPGWSRTSGPATAGTSASRPGTSSSSG